MVSSLKAVRRASKSWARRARSPPTLIPNCKFIIYLFDVLEEVRSLSAGERWLRAACQDKLMLAVRERAAYWKQRGKHRAIREGDANTRFFHARATQRLRNNSIRSFEVDGVVVSSHHDKTVALTAYLQGLLHAAPSLTGHNDYNRLYLGAGRASAAPLIAPFTEREARATVRAMNKSSSPGPDGFGPAFYTAAWHTVAPTVLHLAKAFHAGTADLERLNRSFIVLIPKHTVASAPGDYRPICLQNCSLKILSKMMTTRLQ
ncbi:uncharacterized protein [Setaria viridis]|uniref:uncharacterized protein n=1 Tax=Setaria viridis TaxID=4556 RepID=UPI003B3AD2B1